MWWKNPAPITDEDRQTEVRRLEGIRDKLLDEAPMHFYFRRLLLPIMLVMMLIPIGNSIWTSHLPLGSAVLIAGFLFVLACGSWWVWKGTPPLGDRWGFSDTLGYEGNSPRDIQRKIDDLRSPPPNSTGQT